MPAVTALSVTFSIGYMMQYGMEPRPETLGPRAPLEVTDIALTSAAIRPQATPEALVPRVAPSALPQDLSLVATPPTGALPDTVYPAASHLSADCTPLLTGRTGAGALVSLSLTAPCHTEAWVTIRHEGLLFSQRTDAEGRLDVSVPALAERARFDLSFDDGTAVETQVTVSSLAFYDRVALQWRGETGLQLHALEYGAGYFEAGHVWAASSGDLGAAARGEGGFMLRLGDVAAPEASIAEVYSFPALTARIGGDVHLSVEAEVTAENCGTRVAAQTLDKRGEAPLSQRDLVLNMPGCASEGEFLVLNNILEDLTIAGK